jgi:ribosomal protein S18 acetylase RimI-like enzyme
MQPPDAFELGFAPDLVPSHYTPFMAFDPALSLRIANNQRLMRGTHRGQYRDLGGALALTSDAPLPQWNCIEGFTTDERRLDGLLDVGFALLRAFDQPPAVRLTPLDRPQDIETRLRQRGLVERSRDVSLILRGDVPDSPRDNAVVIRRATPEDAGAFATIDAQVNAPRERWARPFLLGAALANVLEPSRAFYLGSLDGEPVGTALCVSDGGVAGIYSVATLRAYRRRGVATALTLRAIADARAGGADTVCLECESGGEAMALYTRLGFQPAHESALWAEP